MKYCVIKDTIQVIDGSENSEEVMYYDASKTGKGYSKDQVEILTEEEYKVRVDSLPSPVVQKTELEILQETVDVLILANLGV